VQESTGTSSRREAEKFYALRISEIERGVYAKPVKTTISEFGEKYLEYAKANKRSWKRDQQIIEHLNRFFGVTVLCDIGPLSIERYKLQRVQSVSPATVNREIALLKHLFQHGGAVGTLSGPKSGAGREVPGRRQSPIPLSVRSGRGKTAGCVFAVPARPRFVRDQYRIAAE
jgi:hypothetical protein